ncbi:GGDEF domain-containing protein [Shewanella algicola]|uniref:diguanylate cyclase n=1 Tax=Shewanella algicola TaxID=640633 RepID=A0A9X1Z3N0_9GAMM|nr:sensor domain-containing diguanylate cyclase [Shewanella algicola]MCL1105141.1 sensor domain-containing diguanylate cyclase [Shewanella algicola]GGP48916.1 GGDEF domain-containing protein [Shewanella algicola]
MQIKNKLNTQELTQIDVKQHIWQLIIPLVLISIILFIIFDNQQDYLYLGFFVGGYLISYVISHFMHKQNMQRLWRHMEQILRINDTTYELVKVSSQYESEQAFLDALLQKAITAVDDAEMGSIILVDNHTDRLQFGSVVGLDIDKLRRINFTLEETFLYRLTKGRLDKTVTINNMRNINAKSTLTDDDQFVLLNASSKPICSTLSSPIRIDGELYGMMNLDSSMMEAFGEYDISLVNILTYEAANAISLYQKSKEIEIMANYDGLTQLYNRKKFDESVLQWQHDSALASYIVILDMDNLKPLNDLYGHQAGDDALKAFAQSLKSIWHPAFLVARYGGDEFIALCHGPLETLETQIIQIQKELSQLSSAIYFSYGIAQYQQDWNKSFKQADSNMYQQKRLKNQRVSL